MSQAGLILFLSGGVSSRMGRPKALLPLCEGCDTTFLERLVDITAELSPRRGVVSSLPASSLPVDLPTVSQPRPEEGQLSSLLLGWRAFGEGAPWVMSCPVDHPYIDRATVRALVEATDRAPGALCWSPSYRGRGGHPVILSAALFPLLEEAPLEGGARPVIRGLGSRRYWLETEDETVLWDVDTPADHARYSSLWRESGRG